MSNRCRLRSPTPSTPARSARSSSAPSTPIGHYDLLIAAQARRHGATLVTANQREFARVPGLDVVDWATPEEI
jgi:predicted nucleic acid-binding protein